MATWAIQIITVVSAVIGLFYINRVIYTVLGFFKTRKFPEAKNFHRYAVLIAARNEEAVIGNLIASIQAQDYPKELVDVFVVADNCTDQTATIATKAGAICYERKDAQHRSKGFALQFLVERIRRDFGIDHYDGYFIFDADNLLKADYIRRMNEAFDAGEKIVTSYRNIKNFSTNWISASYGIHWLRTCRMEHRGRSLLYMACRVQGTGYLFASELIADGWNYTCLTEDRAFCADAVARGYRISYQHDAEFYDEQPDDIRTALRQRLRWAKGNLLVTKQTGGKLLWHIICGKGLYARVLSADMLSIVYPRSMMLLIKKVVIYLLNISIILSVGFGAAAGREIWSLTLLGLVSVLKTYATRVANAGYVLIMERKRMGALPLWKKLWYCLTFPAFDTIGKISCIVALFTKVEWKPIAHKAALRVEQMPTSK